jgi:hypothetical protein
MFVHFGPVRTEKRQRVLHALPLYLCERAAFYAPLAARFVIPFKKGVFRALFSAQSAEKTKIPQIFFAKMLALPLQIWYHKVHCYR